MEDAKLILAHFSPTGGTKKVADAIAAGFTMPVLDVDLTEEISALPLGKKDLLMAVLPVYAGRVPQIALKRLAQLRGEGQKAVAVVVYGNREFDDALLETKDTLEAMGFSVIAGAAFIAEHSIVRSVAEGRPDIEDQKIARQFATDIMLKLQSPTSVTVPGNTPYVVPKASAAHPTADDGCIRCGLCAEHCPTGAIPVEDPGKTDGTKCINCLRCVQLCPQQCRSLPAPFMTWITGMLKENASGYKKPVLFL